ncbi:hypothetical protein B0T16DRAFT_462123 [Cercophora newfieldiana]|uniref:F-box domain-containing protein n=1 Tax=Cercophora newfieldiana TaxID=92897 RepID=A0AA40CKU7_9PEZI|nr:hypothetical protein B0T16DRAFT_462123 [Cercophora newfieldiana]
MAPPTSTNGASVRQDRERDLISAPFRDTEPYELCDPKDNDTKNRIFKAVTSGLSLLRNLSNRMQSIRQKVFNPGPAAISVFRDPQTDTPRSDMVAVASLGQLDRLPLEIQHDILSHIDILSSVRFSRVNKAAHKVLRSTIGYHIATTHAPAVLSAIAQLGMVCKNASSEAPTVYRNHPELLDLKSLLDLLLLSTRVYFRDGYFDHFKWCRKAQELWREAENKKEDGNDAEQEH